jgi:tetratricopeptide (TPR) repeat protein
MKKPSLEEIRTRYKEGRYQEALSLIEKVEQEGLQGLLNPEVLVLKGCCIQLDDEETPYELADAEHAFEQALKIDEKFTPAIIELAWFYLNVLDDAVRAAPLFERAINLHKLMLTEAVIGMAKCLSETKTKDIAKEYLEEIANSLLDPAQIQNAISEIESLEK